MSNPYNMPKAGVMGWPISHSLSPRLHRYWLDHYGIQGSYDALPVKPEDLGAALRALPAEGFRGVNLTIPHKEAAIALVDDIDDTARRIGAVNLVIVDNGGRLQGRNTDAYGFTQNLLMADFKLKSGVAFVLGAGGAARSTIVALSDMGFSEIRVANRTKDRAERLAQEFTASHCAIYVVDWRDVPQKFGNVDLLVNTTSLGMMGQPALEIDLGRLPNSASVNDIVYAPLETALLQQAKQRGLASIDGLGMLLHQARPSFQGFFGLDPEVTQALRDAVLAVKI